MFIFDTSKTYSLGILNLHLKNATPQVELARKSQLKGKINNSPSTCSDAFSGLWNCGHVHDYFSLFFISAILGLLVLNLGPRADMVPNASVKFICTYKAINAKYLKNT